MSKTPVDIGKAMLENFIIHTWSDLYIGSRRAIPFPDTVQFPSTALVGMDLRFSRDHVEVDYANETLMIDWSVNPKTGVPEGVMFSSNWSQFLNLFVPVQQTLLLHLLGLIKIGAV